MKPRRREVMATQNIAGRRRPLVVEIEASPAYEFLMTLFAFSDAENYATYDVGIEWFNDVRKKASADLLAAVEQLGFDCDEIGRHMLGLVYDCPAPRDVPTFIALIEATDPLELRLHMLGYYVRHHHRTTSPEIILHAAQGDTEAQKKLLNTSSPDDAQWQTTLRRVLSLEPAAMKNLLLDIFHDWYAEVFREQEPLILPPMACDAETKLALKPTVSPEQLIEIATGFEYVPEPGIQRVVLIPSYILRPWNVVTERYDTRIVCYPVADESISADSHAPPARLVKLAKALADERRLRILKKLATGSYTLQEMAEDLGLAKTTLHHHIITLRSAGLVRMRMSDKRWSLRQGMINNVGELLNTYLKETPLRE